MRFFFASALDFLELRVRGGESLCLLCWCHPARCHADGIAAVGVGGLSEFEGHGEGPGVVGIRNIEFADGTTVFHIGYSARLELPIPMVSTRPGLQSLLYWLEIRINQPCASHAVTCA